MEPSEASGTTPGASEDTLGQLLTLSSRGDDSAFAELYDRTASRVHGLCKRVVRDPAQAEEVTQETFLDVWRNSSRFDEHRGSVIGWILTIAHRRSVDRVRSAESARDRDTRFTALSDLSVDDLDDSVSRSLEAARVRRAMATLTDVQREAITLAYFGGYTYREVAELLGVPLGTIKTRMRDGLIRLRDALGHEDRTEVTR